MIYVCHGVSMLPTFPKLGLVSIKKAHSYKIGDIISLKTLDNKYHCHRISTIDSKYVSTKGDNLDQQLYEINVPIKNIEGIVKLIFPQQSLDNVGGK
jgi:hypothetical protein